LLIVSDRMLETSHPAQLANAIVYRPRSLVLGVGCDRGISSELFERGILALLAQYDLSPKCINSLASIDKKADEIALLSFAEKYAVPTHFFTAAELDAVSGIENPSAVVHKHVGTRGVSEPAALLASGERTLLVPKTIYTEKGAERSMTVAIARIPHLFRQEAS
jgi:cobalt-precorrin 5A hydrolase